MTDEMNESAGGGRPPRWTPAEVRRRRAAGEPVPKEIAQLYDAWTRPLPLDDLRNWLHGGAADADWALLVLTRDDRELMGAVRRILGRLNGSFIHPKRWRAHRGRLIAAARASGATIDEKADDHSPAATWVVVDRVRLRDWDLPQLRADQETLLTKFRDALTTRIMEDLLGPGWRRYYERGFPADVEYEDDLKSPPPGAPLALAQTRPDAMAAEAAAALGQLHRKIDQIGSEAALSRELRDTLHTMLVYGDNHEAAAQALGIKQGAYRKRRHTLRHHHRLQDFWAYLRKDA